MTACQHVINYVASVRLGSGLYTVLRRRLLDVVNKIMAYVLCELLLDIIQ